MLYAPTISYRSTSKTATYKELKEKKIYMFPNIHSACIYTANSHKMFF